MKMRIIFLFLPCLAASLSLFSQSNIQQSLSVNSTGAAPEASAQLDVSATDKGMLVPRMTSAQRSAIASPTIGLLVFDTDTGGFWFHNGVGWLSISASRQLVDTDLDTKIQVEESPDEDIIRFDIGGTEKMVLRQNVNGAARLELPDVANNTIIGQEAGVNNIPGAGTTAEENVFLGYRAGNANTTGEYNTFVGSQAGLGNVSGVGNTAIGAYTLQANATGHLNTAIGLSALYSNTTGSNNTAQGAYALNFNTAGFNNTAIGDHALSFNNFGHSNTANGWNAMRSNNNGHSNTANGATALYSNMSGALNTANGFEALYSNTSANSNTATGAQALRDNTTGEFNTASGDLALRFNSIGTHNTANGASALIYNSVGTHNTAVGILALSSNTEGTHNTAIGAQANVSASYLTNATAIGDGASVNASNKVRIGNTAVTVIEGNVAYSVSDGRFKSDIRSENVPGLSFIRHLQPVTYHFEYTAFSKFLGEKSVDYDVLRQREQATEMGFVAQDLEKIMRNNGVEVANLLHVPAGEGDNYSIAYGQLVVPLVKAVQEQQAIIETLKLEIGNWKSETETLKTLLETQEAQLQKISAALESAGIGVER